MARTLNKAAAVYARTLLDLASAQGAAAVLREEFAALSAELAKTPAFAQALRLPMLSAEKKAALVKPLADKGSDLFRRLLRLLEIKGRLALLPDVADAYLRLEEEARRVRRARVVSAVALSPEQLGTLSEGLARRSAGATYILENVVDPSLIAGFRVEEDGFVTDTSLRHKLDGLRQRLAAA